ncbi:hypothetical protein VSH64_24885 [Amycolatopsis rhabdoformis]|uniref:Uncharacterized protein n=1 Tax=Amycolatopsis rhabdoformis TaxID=1448059 RepID=A0ABZ1HUR9_9PSEU|nr:hypothetical protein [Amycolatopsis rhabdoformis]WSE26114.1 hypothetical protein VSH64_24885 [Amycolatopsis rhabdoformis]
MADTLATAADLRALLDEDETSLTDDKAAVLLQLATGAVQAAAGQDLLAVVDDTAQLLGDTDVWLTLPQRPVTAVSSVSIDGRPVTDFKRFGDRLWRRCGWATCPGEPSVVDVVNSHGYEDWDSKLGLARSAVLSVAARMFANPVGVTGQSIDDFSQQFSQSTNSDLSGLIPENLRKSLRRAYGARARFVKL